MKFKAFFILLLVLSVLYLERRIEACSLAPAGAVYPEHDMENVPTNGFIAFFSYQEPEDVQLVDEEGERIDLISLEEDHPLYRYFSFIHLFRTTTDLDVETHYFLRAQLGDRDFELNFTTGEGRDDLPPAMGNDVNVGIDFHGEGEAFWVEGGGGLCVPFFEVSEEDLGYFEGYGRVTPMEPHYHFDVRLSPITDQAYVTASIFRQQEGAEEEHLKTILVTRPETVPHLLFSLDDVVGDSEKFVIRIQDIFGNQMKKEFTITTKLNGDNSTATVAVQEDDPPPPPPPPEPSESERFGGCSLIRKWKDYS